MSLFGEKNEPNYALCILALGCFFSGANQVRWWWLEYLMSFLPCGWIGSLIFLRNEKKIVTDSPTLVVTPNNQIKYANKIPNTIIETLAMLNLWPSLLSKIIVDEMWNNIPITIAVISV